ncbi:pro-FMRFamide-related neuropeptide FF [Pelobates cultripes]|uniref:Pro-FMRFamide-related neuropeptide FF n=1 Tax=Pelobates cultripes TaxID=61616 RepID=A0AAD1R670_PELCU|nr:pro-FMRFamide-related neuropeptide FF [Pelobates cultripes]
MQLPVLLLISVLACVTCAKSHQAEGEPPENYQEVPPGYLDSQMDESLFPHQTLDERTALNILLRTILHNRPARSSFQFQPQRFGRDERSAVVGDSRIHSRGWDSMAPQFWSMAVPQRFGRKK